jgi:ATP-dependent DNA helicase
MLRRLKSDVDLVIPPKRELLVYAPLTPLQHEMYRSVVDQTIETLINRDEKVSIVPLLKFLA